MSADHDHAVVGLVVPHTLAVLLEEAAAQAGLSVADLIPRICASWAATTNEVTDHRHDRTE